MADAAYPSFFVALWNGQVNVGTDTFKAVVLSSTYVYSSAHTKYSDLSGVLASASMTGIVVPSGVLDADDTPVLAVVGVPHSVVVMQYNAGTPADSRIAFYYDQGVNFDSTQNGTVTVIWPNTVNVKIFPLGGL